jgi:hypothetical protein
MILQAGTNPKNRLEMPVEESIEENLVAEGEGSGKLVSVVGSAHADLSGLEEKGREVISLGSRRKLKNALLKETTGRFVLLVQRNAKISSNSIARAVSAAMDAHETAASGLGKGRALKPPRAG